MQYEELNNNLKTLADKAFDIALDSLNKEKRRFTPFVIFEKDNKLTLKRFQATESNKAFNTLLEYVEDIEKVPKVLIGAYKDYIQLMDGKFDAVVINIYGVEEENGYSFAQLFKVENDTVVLLKKVLFLGNVRNALIF